MLPGEDGLSDLPANSYEFIDSIIMLTALTEEIERVVGLAAGADDSRR